MQYQSNSGSNKLSGLQVRDNSKKQVEDIMQEIADLKKAYYKKCRVFIKLWCDFVTCCVLLNVRGFSSKRLGQVTGVAASLISLYDIWGA